MSAILLISFACISPSENCKQKYDINFLLVHTICGDAFYLTTEYHKY